MAAEYEAEVAGLRASLPVLARHEAPQMLARERRQRERRQVASPARFEFVTNLKTPGLWAAIPPSTEGPRGPVSGVPRHDLARAISSHGQVHIRQVRDGGARRLLSYQSPLQLWLAGRSRVQPEASLEGFH